MSKYTLTREAHVELHADLEHLIMEWSAKHEISGELAWLAMQAYAEARMRGIQSNRL